jgi:RNA polymerase sigma factor FliA
MTTLTRNEPSSTTLNLESAGRCYSLHDDGASEEELVRQHLPLVKSVTGRISMALPAHVDADDLYSAGLVGLLHAVRHFDPDSGSSFETYARVRIRGAVIDELRRLDWVPRSVHEKAKRVQAAIRELEQTRGEVPRDADVAAFMEMPLADYERLIEEIKPATFVCLDSVNGEDEEGGASGHSWIADASQESPLETASRRDLGRIIASRIAELPEMQRKVLALYYYEGLRLREIAALIGLTEGRISQIHAQAILNIKAYISSCETVDRPVSLS